jgi:hypothetical protein
MSQRLSWGPAISDKDDGRITSTRELSFTRMRPRGGCILNHYVGLCMECLNYSDLKRGGHFYAVPESFYFDRSARVLNLTSTDFYPNFRPREIIAPNSGLPCKPNRIQH